MPPPQRTEEEAENFHIGSYDPIADPTLQAFDYVLDADEDVYHVERTVAYFKV